MFGDRIPQDGMTDLVGEPVTQAAVLHISFVFGLVLR